MSKKFKLIGNRKQEDIMLKIKEEQGQKGGGASFNDIGRGKRQKGGGASFNDIGRGKHQKEMLS